MSQEKLELFAKDLEGFIESAEQTSEPVLSLKPYIDRIKELMLKNLDLQIGDVS